MKKKNPLKNEKGFTLIEIIAVIIIMGILAAVAVPKFFSMQEDAKEAALNGALSEAAARFNHAFARYILDNKKAPSDVAGVLDNDTYLGAGAATDGVDIGDFKVTWKKDPTSGDLLIEVVEAPTVTDDMSTIDAALKTKQVSKIEWGN